MFQSLLLGFAIFISAAAFAKTGPLFATGAETFRVVNDKGQTPTYRVLKDSVLKQSLAIAVNTKWKLNGPGSETHPYVDLKIEKVMLTPEKNKPKEVALAFQVSGKEFEVDTPISRDDLVKGKTIPLKLPLKTEQLSVFKATSQGHMNLRYQKSEDILLLEDGFAKMQIESPLSDDESESIRIKARGIRL